MRVARGVAGGLAAGLAAWLLAAAPAGAGIKRAETITPPGQSGFVSVPGLATGTGSPHLYDQTEPFIEFDWKPARFNLPGATEHPRAGVRIVRDSFGVPAVTGDSDYDVWWGAGYAIAQDRLFELDLFRHATQGRLSEIAGPSRLSDDRLVRQDFYTPNELDEQYEGLPDELQDRFTAYRDGVNAWIAHVRTHPDDLPGEYPATATVPRDWTVLDSVAIGVYLARTIPTNADPHSLELANLRAVRESGTDVLQALVPLRTPNSLVTIPGSEKHFSSQPGRSRRQERRALQRSAEWVEGLELPDPNPNLEEGGGGPPVLVPGGSYMFAVRDGDRALLYNGPQLGFSAPERIVELEVHGPEFDVRGLTAPGVPIIGAGFNRHVAWGITTGASDADDLYAEELVDGDDERYRFKDDERSMDCRDEQLNYKTPPSDLLGVNVPRVPPAGSVTVRVCRTVHGPVEARGDDVAYARRYAQWGREIETLEGLAALNQARDIDDVDEAVRQFTWNENVMAADDEGNIGYWHPGLLPLRPRGWDERLPYPGTGEAEWRGLLDRDRQLPFVINPEQGWLANWNNLPAKGWTSGDGTARKRMDGSFFRVGLLFRAVRDLKRDPSFNGLKRVIRHAGTTAQQFPIARPRLAAAARDADGEARKVLQTLLDWDGSYHKTNDQGTVHPGVATWDAFRAEVGDRVEELQGEGSRWLADENVMNYLDPGYDAAAGYHYFEATHLQSYGLRTLSREHLRKAARRAYEELADRFGSQDPDEWREPRRLYDWAILGGESPPELPFFDRGTWEQLVELGS